MTSRAAAARGAVLVACAAVALSGCAGAGVDAGAVPFERPGWMADQDQRQAEHREALQGCVAGKGWNVTVDQFGGVVEPFDDADFPRWESDRDACRAEMGLGTSPTSLSRDRAELVYERQVDTWRCVLDAGHDVPAPPSREAFVEEITGAGGEDGAGVTVWGPYGDLPVRLSAAEMNALADTCPEPWWAE